MNEELGEGVNLQIFRARNYIRLEPCAHGTHEFLDRSFTIVNTVRVNYVHNAYFNIDVFFFSGEGTRQPS